MQVLHDAQYCNLSCDMLHDSEKLDHFPLRLDLSCSMSMPDSDAHSTPAHSKAKTWTMKKACMYHKPYTQGQPIAQSTRCPLPGCRGSDSATHIMLECTHPDMKKQHIARYDAMMRLLIREVTKGKRGSQYMIADVGTLDKLKEIGVHSKRVPSFILPDSRVTSACYQALAGTPRLAGTEAR